MCRVISNIHSYVATLRLLPAGRFLGNESMLLVCAICTAAQAVLYSVVHFVNRFLYMFFILINYHI